MDRADAGGSTLLSGHMTKMPRKHPGQGGSKPHECRQLGPKVIQVEGGRQEAKDMVIACLSSVWKWQRNDRKTGGVGRGPAGKDRETRWEDVRASCFRLMHSRKGAWGQRDRLLLCPMCRDSGRHGGRVWWHPQGPLMMVSSEGLRNVGSPAPEYILRSFETWLVKGRLVTKPPTLVAAGTRQGSQVLMKRALWPRSKSENWPGHLSL